MVGMDELLPYLMLKVTLLLELIAFLSSHMIDNRNLAQLHEGIFHRCTYPMRDNPTGYNCLWWSSDTFSADRPSLQFVTILVFISLFLLGFTLLFGILSFYYKELRTRNYNNGMSVANLINVVILVLIIITYTFIYASDTKLIPGSSTALVFSWSYYLLFAALGTNIMTSIFFYTIP